MPITDRTTVQTPAADRSARAGGPSRRGPLARWTTLAGAGYVTSWLVGLAVAPAAPEPDAPATEIAAHYAEHGSAVLLSSTFVHGTAALALALFAVAVARAPGVADGLARAVVGTGLAAAALSLVQVVLAALAVARDGVSTRADLFTGINLVDVLKIAFLAGFVAVTTTAVARGGAAPRWLSALAVVLVPALVVGCAAFLVVSPVLMSVLAASLLGLLAWVGATAFVTRSSR